MKARKNGTPKPGHAARTAVVLIAHGSRKPEANDDLVYVVEELRRRARYAAVEPSYLELAKPTVAEAAALCLDQGAARVILLPYFLSAGVHVQRDLTALCRRLSAAHPHVPFLLAEPLGRHPLLLEAVADRARQAEAQPTLPQDV